jgi:hypothetical protein
MLVDPRLLDAPLEFAERRHQEAGLAHQPLRAAIVRRRWLERGERQPGERFDVVLVAAQLVVERENRRDQPGPQLEGWLGAGVSSGTTGHAEQHLTLGRGEHRRVQRQSAGERANHFSWRDEVRQHTATAWRQGLFETAL